MVAGANWFKVLQENAMITIVAGIGFVIITAMKEGYEEEVED